MGERCCADVRTVVEGDAVTASVREMEVASDGESLMELDGGPGWVRSSRTSTMLHVPLCQWGTIISDLHDGP